MDVESKGTVDMEGFVAQARTSDQAEELQADFAAFDATGVPDGQLTFRKFVTGTMKTPLGRLKQEQFEVAVSGMISETKAALEAKKGAAEGAASAAVAEVS